MIRIRNIRALASALLLVAAAACGNRELLTPSAKTPDVGKTTVTGWPDSYSTITLVWSVPEGIDYSHGFHVWRDGALVGTTKETRFTDRGLKPNTKYVYAVSVIHADGTDTAISNNIELTTMQASPFRVAISPATGEYVTGNVVQLVASVTDSATGNEVQNQAITWSSNNAAVATVSNTGLLTMNSPGDVLVAAVTAGGSGQALYQVHAPVPAGVASLTVSPNTSIVEVAKSVQLSAIARDSNGTTLTDRAISWTSSNASVATVSTNGVVSAIAPGSVLVTATSEGKSASAVVAVVNPTVPNDPTVPGTITSITVTPALASLNVGGTQQLVATAHDALGNVLTGRTITWSSLNGSIATVSSTGVVTAAALGSTVVTASSGGATGSAVVNVIQLSAPTPTAVSTVIVSPAVATANPGSVTQFNAITRDATGNVLTGRTVTWSSSNANVAIVSGNGQVTAVSTGAVTITATSEGAAGTALLTVQAATAPPAPVASLSVAPAQSNLLVGSQLLFVAVTRDVNGNVLTGRIVSWSSSNSSVASVSASGVVSANAAGTATITATSEGVTGTATVTVTGLTLPAAVNSITVSPATASIYTGGNAQFTAITKDASGNVLTGRAVLWTTSNPLVATVSQSGLVTAQSAGSATITATSEGKSGAASLTVNGLPVSTLTVAPSTLNLIIGASGLEIAITKDANGILLVGRAVVWSSSNNAVATVTQAGVVTGVSAGSVIITATSEGVSGTGAVSVLPKPVSSIVIATPAGFCAGTSVQLQATTLDAQGIALTGRVVTWTTSNASIATVNNSGLAVGLAVGGVTLTATSEGVSSSVTVSLCPIVAATVTIPSAPSLLGILSLPQLLSAVAKDANGNVITGHPVTWSVTPSARALISPLGLLTILGLGPITVTATVDGISASVTISIIP